MPVPEEERVECFGVDIGASNTSCCDSTGELHRNELGGHSTASFWAVSGQERQLGEAAVMGLSANARNTVTSVGQVGLASHANLASACTTRHMQCGLSAAADGSVDVSVDYGGEPRTFSSLAVLGALLGKLRATSKAPVGAPLAVALPALPGAATEADTVRARLADAAAVGGWKLVAAPAPAAALAAVLARKYPFTAADVGGAARLLLIVDVGHGATSASVVRVLPPPAGASVDAERSYDVLAERTDGSLGCGAFDDALFSHFAAQIEAKHGEPVAAGTRRGLRLLTACERLRKLLSTLPEAATTAENLIDGLDVPLKISRDEMNALLEPKLVQLRSLFDAALAAAAEASPAPSASGEGEGEVVAVAPSLHGVEAVGGGMRMPAVQAVLTEALRASPLGAAVAEDKLGAKLDDASVALGAALVGRASVEASADAAVAGVLPPEALAALVAEEAMLAAADAAAASLGAARNEMEGFILESRGLTSRKHGALIDSSALSPLLDAAEDWLYSEEAEVADLPALNAKSTELHDAVSALTAAYREKVAADKAQEEAALEAASAAAAAERAANGEDEDHDTRKLKFPDRLRLVLKNKEEGTELFQGQNWRPAAARYNKALTHAAKFVDLSPDQRAEVDAVKLSLHLNIAQCWLKITDATNNLEQAIRSCDDALALSPTSVKAIYRRAVAREAKGDYDAAKEDLKKAAELAPDDTAVPKLMARVEAQLKRQAAKEKKMYGKMFG